MKKIIVLFILSLAIACQEQDAVPTKPIDDNFEPGDAVVVREGMFIGIGHTVSGTVKIYDDNGTRTLLFDPFMSQNGPDLKVYLSKDQQASEYLRLGVLQSTTGKQSYTIPSGTNLEDYLFVHIWCEKFSVEFARAELK